MTPEQRKESIAKGSWLSEVMADERFKAVIKATKEEIAENLTKAEEGLVEAAIKDHDVTEFKDKVLRLRYGSNVLDLLLIHMQAAIEDGRMQSGYLDMIDNGEA